MRFTNEIWFNNSTYETCKKAKRPASYLYFHDTKIDRGKRWKKDSRSDSWMYGCCKCKFFALGFESTKI